MNEPQRVDLRKAEIALLRKLEGVLHGERLAIRFGDGSTPTEPRLYNDTSDDARRIDWALSDRFDELWVKQTVADRELTVTFIVDMSSRMFLGTAKQEKRNTAISAIWSLALLLNGGSNKMSAVVSHNQATTTKWYRPGSGRTHRLNLISYLRGIPVEKSGEVDLGSLIKGTTKKLKRRGQLVFVFSDFLAPGWEKALRRLSRKHTVYCVRIIDQWDLELKDEGWIILKDAVTGELLGVDSSDSKARDAVKAATTKQGMDIKRDIVRSKARYIELKTDGSWANQLIDQLNSVARSRRGRRAA